MKHSFSGSRSSRPSGFTLVELLVVMGIIAILAGVLLSVAGAAIRAAKRASAANTASQIQTACTSYYTEYGVYPIPSSAAASSDFVASDTDQADWQQLIIALSGNIDPANPSAGATATSTVSNTRGIAFITMKASDLLNDAPKNPLPPNATQLYFNIAMDGDYDGILGKGSSTTSALPNFTTAVSGTPPNTDGSSTAGIAVWADCNGNATTQNPAFWVRTY